MRPMAWVLLLFLAQGSVARADEAAEKQRVDRLVGLARLWGTVRYFHPWIAYRDIDWDAALLRSIPRVSTARDVDEYRAAVADMLLTLQDPATRVTSPLKPSTPVPSGEPEPTWKLGDDGVLTISVHRYTDLQDFAGTRDRLGKIAETLGSARAVVFDLRAAHLLSDAEYGYLGFAFGFSGIERQLSATAVVAPGERRRMHVGFAPQQGSTSGGYYSAFYTTDGQSFTPTPPAKDRPVAFVVNAWSELPAVALALQAAGKAVVIAEGEAGDSGVVTQQTLVLPGGVETRVRLGELVAADGGSGFAADINVSATASGDTALEAALAWVRSPMAMPRSRVPLPPVASQRHDKPYADPTYPPTEYRLLAGFRAFAVLDHFFPYKDLMDETWEDALREAIPRLEAARDATEYALALSAMMAHGHDSHISVASAAMRSHWGVAAAPVLLRWIEDQPVIAGFRDEATAKEAGLAVGDVVLKVDGEDVHEKINRLKPYLAASTLQSLMLKAMNWLCNGADGSTAVLTTRSARGQLREAKVIRRTAFQTNASWRTGPIYRLLPGKIGYADLDRLPASMVDEVFDAFKDTRAIIFDVRGYPRGTAWSIAPRLTDRHGPVAARFDRPVLLGPPLPNGEIESSRVAETFLQRIPKTDKWRYHGKTVMLIDERTMSQAEHTGLFFEAANGTVFVGSATAGANGDVTDLIVPGGVTISFTGQSVRHADGRQLQRVGLQPQVEVRPTIDGLRAGRDEVLDAAAAYLERELR